MRAAYEITTDEDSIVVRLSRTVADEEALAKLLDYLELEAIRRRSELTSEDALHLADEIKGGAWKQVKHLFEED